jgi:hypothetical protein
LQEFEKIVHHEEILFYGAVLGMRLLQFCRPSDVALRGGGVVEGRLEGVTAESPWSRRRGNNFSVFNRAGCG